jgi:hypothetical protein
LPDVRPKEKLKFKLTHYRLKASIDIIIRFCNTDSGQTFSPTLFFLTGLLGGPDFVGGVNTAGEIGSN